MFVLFLRHADRLLKLRSGPTAQTLVNGAIANRSEAELLALFDEHTM
jgi:hypothetical protein